MAKKNYLIEGVSGSGKSSVCRKLHEHGYKTVDGDKELAYQGNPETGEPVEGFSHQNHIWNVEKVISIIEDKNEPVTFFCGGSRNFNKFINKFEEVFILNVDDETIRRRIKARGDNFGSKPEELELILKMNQTKEDIPRIGINVDATMPLNQVVNEILMHIKK